MSRLRLALVWAGLAALPAPALDPAVRPSQHLLATWADDRGLPADSVKAIARTPDGYLWLGTPVGLARFDGTRFAQFGRANTPAFRGQDVWAVLADRAGGLWVGTDDGLVYRSTDGAFRGYGPADGLPAKHVTCLAEGPDGDVWGGTLGGGVFRLRGGAVAERVGPDAGLTPANVWAVHPAADGTVWVGTVAGLFAGRGGRFTRLGDGTGLPSSFVLSLLPAADGGLWVGTIAGLCHLRDGRATVTLTAKDGLPADRIKCLLADRDGSLWAGCMGGGLARVRDGRVAILTDKHGLPAGGVYALYECPEGCLWLGSVGGGLVRLTDGRVTPFTARHGLPGQTAVAVAEGPDGTVWAATDGGLARLAGGAFVPVTAAGLPAKLEAVCATRDGAVWVGAGNAVYRLRGGAVERFELDRPADRRDRPNTVAQIFEDAAGVLWVASGSGLQRLAGGKFVALTEADGLAVTHALCVCEAEPGLLWVGSRGGLNTVRGGAVGRPDLDGFETEEVTALHRGADGTVWVGTKAGLARASGGTVARCGVVQGLPADEIHSVTADRDGHPWVGTRRGLARVDRRLFDGGPADGGAVRVFRTDEGLPHNYCAGQFHHPALLTAADGRVWVATDRGMGRVDPGRRATNPVPPAVVIEGAAVDGTPAPAGAVAVPAGARRIEFRFAGLAFRAPERVRYEYRLDGYDRDWLPAGAAREAAYTGLPPGGYRFLVRAANEDGVWTPEPAAVPVTQEPHFYQTGWFLALCGLAAAAVGFALHRLRLRTLRARDRLVRAERTRVARELHDTVLQEVSGAVLTLDALADGLPDAVERSAVAGAARHVRAGLVDCRHAVWELRAAGLSDLPGALAAAARDLIAGGDVALTCTTRGAPWELPPAAALALFRIGREAVANVVRHAAPAAVRVELLFTRTAAVLTVADDGSGFVPPAGPGDHGAAVGLVGMRERAAEVGATLAVDSKPGAGTRVTVRLRRPGRLARLLRRLRPPTGVTT